MHPKRVEDPSSKSMKNEDYYSVVRTEILPLLPKKMEHVLDVGCGVGVTGAYLKEKMGAARVSGIEIVPAAAVKAKEVLDNVISIDLNSSEPLPFSKNDFDLVLCLDVLEHLVDPWQALEGIVSHLKPNGTVIVSVPNVRHFRTVLPLLLMGRFVYEEHGVRDSTHLRFFTKQSAVSLVAGAGLTITSVIHTGRPRWSKTWFLNIISFGLFREFFDFQYVIAAKKVVT